MQFDLIFSVLSFALDSGSMANEPWLAGVLSFWNNRTMTATISCGWNTSNLSVWINIEFENSHRTIVYIYLIFYGLTDESYVTHENFPVTMSERDWPVY